jgi:hypothetical protein
MRVMYRNAVKRATLSATSVGGHVIDNLKTYDKSKFFRAPGTSATITGTFAVAEIISCMHLPICNASPTATRRVRLYSGAPGVGLVLDTGTGLACPAPARELEDWTPAQAASAYANGGGAHAFGYFAPTLAKSFVIDIVDTNNLQGYFEAAGALWVGAYWELEYGATGATFAPIDSTVITRDGAGGQIARAGTIHRKLPIDLGYMGAIDRTRFVDLAMNSRSSPILVDVLHTTSDLALRRDAMIIGRRSEDSEIALQFASYATKIDVVEI